MPLKGGLTEQPGLGVGVAWIGDAVGVTVASMLLEVLGIEHERWGQTA